MHKCISDVPLTDVKTEQDGETGCRCWELKCVSGAGDGNERSVRASQRSRAGRGGAACDSEWKEVVSTEAVQPGAFFFFAFLLNQRLINILKS